MASAADRRLFWGVAGGLVIADLVTKLMAEAQLTRRMPLSVVGEWVQLRLVYNQGAAFGIHVGEHSRWVFMVLALIALGVLGSMVRTTRPGDRFRLLALALVCGGATGNLIDRLLRGRVTDFISIGNFPVFNVADSSITVGCVVLVLGVWWQERAAKREKTRAAGSDQASEATSE